MNRLFWQNFASVWIAIVTLVIVVALGQYYFGPDGALGPFPGSRLLLLLIAIAATVLVSYTSALIFGGKFRRLDAVFKVGRAAAAGDLTVRVSDQVGGEDEIGQLAQDLDKLIVRAGNSKQESEGG